MGEAHPQNGTWRTIFWIFTPLYVIALVYLLLLGEVMAAILWFASGVYQALLALLARRITEPFPPEEVHAPQNKGVLWAQIAVIAIIILLTGWQSGRIPLWSAMDTWLHRLGEAALPMKWFGGPGNAVANPVRYFVIPFILLMILGARPGELGFGKGHRAWQVGLLWWALPALMAIVLLSTGSLAAQALVQGIIGNTFQNGFFEEFLFRGALQTRLRRLLPLPWTLAIQALVFGLWHIVSNTQSMQGNALAGLAICIVMQTVLGFAFGYVFHRTGNLLAPSLAHVATNVLGSMFG